MQVSKTKITDFTQGNITKQLTVFAWPLLLSNILQVVYSMVDMVIVGNVAGEAGLAGVTVGGEVTSLITNMSMGFASAIQVLIARYIGARENEKIGRFVGTSSAFLIVFSIAMSILGIAIQTPMLKLMNTPAEAYEGALAYSTVCLLGLVFIYGYNIVSAILRGMGDSKHPMLFIAIAAVMNLILDVIFVIYMDLGALGAALATVISQATSFILCTVFLVMHKSQFELNITRRDFFHWDKEMLSDFLKLGMPMAIKFSAISISKLFVNSWINAYGVVVSAFAGVANKLATVGILFSNSMNAAGSTMVGQNIAAGKFGRVRRILLTLLAVTMFFVVIFSLIYALVPEAVIGLFTDSVDVIALAREYIPIAVIMFIGCSPRATLNALMNGSGNSKINFVTAILDSFVVRIGLSVLFGIVMEMGYMGFWLGDAIAGYTPVVVGMVFYLSGSWKKSAKLATDET